MKHVTPVTRTSIQQKAQASQAVQRLHVARKTASPIIQESRFDWAVNRLTHDIGSGIIGSVAEEAEGTVRGAKRDGGFSLGT